MQSEGAALAPSSTAAGSVAVVAASSELGATAFELESVASEARPVSELGAEGGEGHVHETLDLVILDCDGFVSGGTLDILQWLDQQLRKKIEPKTDIMGPQYAFC